MLSISASSSRCARAGTSSTSTAAVSAAAFAHRFLPGTKGGLYAWEKVQHCSEVILVEGLFDYAVLWQAGFHNVTCSLGTHLNADQFRQLCEGPRTVYLTFDVDANRSGQQAARAAGPSSPGARVSLLAASSCPRATIPTPSSSRAAMHASSSLSWRLRSHEVPRHLPEDLPRAHIARFRWSSRPPARELAGSIVTWTASMSAAWPTRPCAATLTACCTSCAGGRAFITPATFAEGDLTESTLLDYVRFQSSQQPPPSASTINDRVATADRAIRNEFPDAPCQIARGFHQAFLHRRPMGLGRPARSDEQTAREGAQAQHRPSLGR